MRNSAAKWSQQKNRDFNEESTALAPLLKPDSPLLPSNGLVATLFQQSPVPADAELQSTDDEIVPEVPALIVPDIEFAPVTAAEEVSEVPQKKSHDQILRQILAWEEDPITAEEPPITSMDRRMRAINDPMFCQGIHAINYNYYNTQKTKRVWDIRSDMTFGLALSVYGTSRIKYVQAKYDCFKGFSPGNLAARLYNWMHYHSTDHMKGFQYDLFKIRLFFQDAERA